MLRVIAPAQCGCDLVDCACCVALGWFGDVPDVGSRPEELAAQLEARHVRRQHGCRRWTASGRNRTPNGGVRIGHSCEIPNRAGRRGTTVTALERVVL